MNTAFAKGRFGILRLLGYVWMVVCSTSGGDAAEASVISIVSPHNESIRVEFGRAFQRWHQDKYGASARVEWRDVGGSSEALRFVQSEFSRKPDGIGLDVFFGGGVEPHSLLAQKGWVTPIQLPPEVLDFIPQKLHGQDLWEPERRWFGAAISSFGLLQNLRIQSKLGLPSPTRWEDLADHRLFGWIGAGDPRGSGTMLIMFESILQFHGWEKGWSILTRMGANCRKFDRVSSTTAKDVTVGETAVGLAIDFYGFSQVAHAGRTNAAFILPTDFATMAPDPISVLKGSPNPEGARRFLEFVLGEPGQKLWYFPKGHPDGSVHNSIERLPVRPDLYDRFPNASNVGSSPFARKQDFRYDGRKARERREVLPVLLGAALVDSHHELRAAWTAIIQGGLNSNDVARLGAPPMTENELATLAAGPWKTHSVRLQKRLEWQRWAQGKYRSISKTGTK